jgi:hypothetical protein
MIAIGGNYKIKKSRFTAGLLIYSEIIDHLLSS